MRSRENGNILFLILLAIVLFAALSYAVTRDMDVKDQGGMSKEAADAAAADILGWFGQLDVAVQRLRIIKGYPVEQIDFTETTNISQDGSVFNSDNQGCTSSACEVFSPNGGGVASRVFEQYGDQTTNTGTPGAFVPGHKGYMTLNTQDVGTPLNDVAVRISGIKRPICEALNRKLGFSSCPSISQTGGWVNFSGTPANIATFLAHPSPYTHTGPEIKGKVTYCSCGYGGTTIGAITHIVIER